LRPKQKVNVTRLVEVLTPCRDTLARPDSM
jgi:hypothetical protein